MKALVTGASSGIGMEIVKYLDTLGYEIIMVSRDKQKMESVKNELKNKNKIVVIDLKELSSVKSLYILTKNENIDFLVNCAGFGIYGEFLETDLNRELELLDTNVRAVQVLTKLFLKDMKKRNFGYILNVSSSASFTPGPLMSTYYASKAYITSFTKAIKYEIKKDKLNIKISCLCPGPVNTNFNDTAGVHFSVKPLESAYVARYAIDKTLNGKLLIIPGLKIKLAYLLSRFIPDNIKMHYIYNMQKKKNN